MSESLLFNRRVALLIMVGTAIILSIALAALADVSGTLLPIGDGTYRQWTPKSGATHYAMVNESVCNGTTDYVYTNTSGHRDSYPVSLNTIPNGSTITAVEITPCASRNRTGSGSSLMNVFYRLNGVNSADAGNYLLVGTTPTGLTPTSFNGLSSIKSSGTTLEVGAVFSSGNRGARLGRMAARVTYTLLVAPSALDATNVSSTQNHLMWTDNSTNEDGFRVERSVGSSSGPWSVIASTTANITAYDDMGLTPNQTYYYRVQAFNSGGVSAYSNIDFATTSDTIPNAPSNLTATASSTSIRLNWTDNSTNEDGFRVERSVDNINFAEVASVGANVTSHTDLNLTSGTYYYRVRAFNVIGNSAYSNTASTTVP